MTDAVEEDTVTVSKVCQDFRVREDGVLASKLQEEEFQKHYIRNKSERKTVRGDVRVAKQTYLEEVKTAQLLPEQELEELSMEETDKWLARDLQEKLHEEERKEMERQKRLSTKDAKVAKSFQEREKERYDREWRRRREEETLGRETQEREHHRIEQEDVDEQTALEMRDARMARELQERERQKYERERERYRHERERERHRHEREQRRERERERMDGQEMDRQTELEMRDARLARELQEREKQKFDREWHRRREQEILEEQERRHYHRSTSEPVDARRTASRPPGEAVNGHAEPAIHRQNRSGSGREDKREKRKSSGSNSSGGSVGKEDRRSREERRLPREERIPPRERTPPKEERRSPREERIPSREERRSPEVQPRLPKEERVPLRERTSPKEERRSPKEERIPPREERRSPKVERRLPREERRPPKEERKYDNGENAVVALPRTENGVGRLEHDRIIMADGTAIQLFEDEDKQKAIAEEKQKALERERQKALERERQQALEKEKQKALEQEKLKKDEEYAKMLQDQERRIVEAERMAAEDRRLALEEQDRELARQLQRQEYQRMQQEKKERQMRRANSIPSDRHSVNLEDPRRLPSYDEAVYRRQLPDLLPGNDPTTTRYSYVSTTSSGGHASSLERQTNAEVEREKYAAQEEDRYQRPLLRSRGPAGSDYRVTSLESHGSREPEGFSRVGREGTSSLDREEKRYIPIERDDDDDIEGKQSARDYREDRQPVGEDTHLPKDQGRSFPVITDFECPDEQDSNHDNEDHTDLDQAVWQTREPVKHSPPSSLERLQDNSGHTQLSARSSYASSGGNSYDRRSQTSGHAGTPPTREDVWERFDDDEEFYNATGRSSRQMFRSQTVASSHPTNHESERHMTYNVVENIDPTFRRPRKHSEDDPKDGSTEERTKVMQLIKPQRRRSTDKKKSKEKKK